MSYPRAYVYAMAALSVVLVAVRWLWGVPVDVWQLLLLVAVHTILATRTIALPSGLVLNAGVPLANAAMALLRPWDAALVVVPGAIAVSVQRRRPWPLALTNLTATALPSLIGSWLYYQLLGFLPDGGAWRLVAFLPAILMRDLVNLLVLLPVLQHRQRKPWLAVLTGSLRERGWGPLTLNLVGFAVAELVRQSGPLLLLYAMVVLLGLHRAVEFHLRRSEVQRAAERDGLTMARNRYTFERVARQVDWTGAVAVMDCNGLKRLNDSAGHQAGDAALRALTTTLVGAAGEEHVYRYGGDEFVVLLHDPARLEALAAALDEFNRTARISVSLGTCLVPQEAADIPAAFALADSRMYGVKGAYPAAQQPAAALQRSLEDTLELIRPLLSLAAEQTGAAIGVRSPAGSWPLRCGPGDGPSEAELFRLPAASRRSGEARARQHRLQLGDGWLLVMQEPPALPPDRSNLLQTTSATVRRIWQQGSRQRLINLVFAAAVSGHDLETSLEHMEREITRHVPFDRFRLLLLDESRRLLDVYERLSTADLNPSPRQLDLGRATQAAAAIETGQPVQSPELAESTGGVRTLLAVPLLTGQHVFGVAEFSSRRPRQFTQSDVELLCTVPQPCRPGCATYSYSNSSAGSRPSSR